jgi:hypothetical protein
MINKPNETQKNVCPACFYYSVTRHGPICNCFGTCSPYTIKGECPRFTPAAAKEKEIKAENTQMRLLVQAIDLLTQIKPADLEKIRDKKLRETLQEICFIARNLKAGGTT